MVIRNKSNLPVPGPKSKPVISGRIKVNDPMYLNGAEGMISFCENHVFVPIYRDGEKVASWCRIGDLPTGCSKKTGKSYHDMWQQQKKVIRECLVMDDDGFFLYKLIILCWQRGEGKSLLACLIQIWKFFCWARQYIMLCANSKDQTKFAHYDLIRDIILNSPDLLEAVGGKKNVQDKEIRKKDSRGGITAIIRSISSFSGLMPNITGYTFSEFFEMRMPREGGKNFFTQIDGSLRNVPNAIGIIDSTVSSKDHQLYHLYCESVLENRTKTIYYSYRQSVNGDPNDYWNPNMDEGQLNDYKIKFPMGEYERYFLNTWSAGAVNIFTDEMIDESKIFGLDGRLINHRDTAKALEDKTKNIRAMEEMRNNRFFDTVVEIMDKVESIDRRFIPVHNYYQLKDGYGRPTYCTIEQLNHIGDLLKTDWALLAGCDFSDIMSIRGRARTIGTIVAKGLPGSKGNEHLIGEAAPVYLYLLLYLVHAANDDLNALKDGFDACHEELGGIDTLCCERYGAWDLAEWCKDRDIKFEPVYPHYDRQKESFNAFYKAMATGMFKRPPSGVAGVKKEDIFDEEAKIFDHDEKIRWYGSREKNDKYGIQDDVMYSVNWTIYGGRLLTPSDFRIRSAKMNFGFYAENKGLLGQY